MKADPGPLGLDTLFAEIGKLATVKALVYQVAAMPSVLIPSTELLDSPGPRGCAHSLLTSSDHTIRSMPASPHLEFFQNMRVWSWYRTSVGNCWVSNRDGISGPQALAAESQSEYQIRLSLPLPFHAMQAPGPVPEMDGVLLVRRSRSTCGPGHRGSGPITLVLGDQ